MAIAGYGLTMTVAGAEVGIPLYTIGSGVSTAGSLMEAVAIADYTKGGFAAGSFVLDRVTRNVLLKSPYLGGTVLGGQIIRQTQGLTLKGLGKAVNGGF